MCLKWQISPARTRSTLKHSEIIDMAKAGRRARARALAMARAAAQRRQQQQAAAEAAHGTSTIEKLPADILGVLFHLQADGH